MDRFLRVVDKTNEWVGRVAAFLMVPLVLITAYEVVMRYVFQRPTIWAWDLNTQIFAAMTMLGGGYTVLQKGHVTVDVFVLGMPPRKRAMLDIATSFFFFLGMVVLVIGGWEMAWMSLKARETMPTVWAPPYYTMKLLVPAGALLVLLEGVADLIRNVFTVFGRETKD
jgi:TRAP-type mannitol/chloroaromatic compound transport system permease small subunit